jgi:CubicO group peptidase (beta-lactamase class C family)
LFPTLTLACTLTLPAAARQSGSPPDRLDSLIQREMKAQQIPGIAVAVIEDGKLLLARAWGYSNLETGTALDTSAVFELASVTKQFTAAAILLLAQEGKVGLDDPVGKYVVGAPAAWARITVRMLLSHTSGLPVDGLPDHEGSPPGSLSCIRPAKARSTAMPGISLRAW